MTKFYYIAFIMLTGFLLTPEQSYAYSLEAHKTGAFSNKPSDAEMKQKDCCKKRQETLWQTRKECGGKCGNPNCHCPTSVINVTNLLFVQHFTNENKFPQTKLLLPSPSLLFRVSFHLATAQNKLDSQLLVCPI